LKYRKRTGVGVDHLWPRWVAWLNDSTLEALTRLLFIIEEGAWFLAQRRDGYDHEADPQEDRRAATHRVARHLGQDLGEVA